MYGGEEFSSVGIYSTERKRQKENPEQANGDYLTQPNFCGKISSSNPVPDVKMSLKL